MTIWFIQGFIQELKIIYVIGDNNKVEEFSVETPYTTENVIDLVKKDMRDENVIKSIILKGKSKTLRELETYYKNLGVDVKWQ